MSELEKEVRDAPILVTPQRTLGHVNPRLESQWEEFGGDRLEPLLRSGAVTLVDAAWIAEQSSRGGRILPRQEMPPTAFIGLNELKAVGCPHGGLPVVVVSCPYLTPGHPDPTGHWLAQIAAVLKVLCASGQRYGVFWDFMCVYHGIACLQERAKRSEEEGALYTQAVNNMWLLYSHDGTTVLQLTRQPDNYPAAWQQQLPASANTAPYKGRGWCWLESAWAGLTKELCRTLDVGKLERAVLEGGALDRKQLVEICTRGAARRPPPTPKAFALEVDNRAYGSKDDRTLVQQLYSKSLSEVFGSVAKLDYDALGWGDAEIEALVEVLTTGCFTCLESLRLRNNDISDAGMHKLAEAVASGVVPPACTVILLDGNPGHPEIVQAAMDQRKWHPSPRRGGRSPRRKPRAGSPENQSGQEAPAQGSWGHMPIKPATPGAPAAVDLEPPHSAAVRRARVADLKAKTKRHGAGGALANTYMPIYRD